jgi:WD40 repeat protein
VEGTKIEQLGVHRSQVRSLAISGDGHRVADGGDDGSLVLRDLRTGRAHVLRGHAGRIRHVAFTSDGRTLLSSDSDGVVRQWSLASLDDSLEADAQAIDHVAASADGALLAAVDAAGDVSTWDAKTRVRTRVGHADGRTVALAIAGTTAVTGTTEGAVTWWLAAPRVQKVPGTVKSIAVGNHHVAVATSTGAIAMFALDGTAEPVLAGNPGGTEVVAFDPTGTLLASGGQDRAVRVWRDGKLLAALEGPTGDTGQLVFSPDGDLLVAGGNDGTVRAWRVNRGEVDGKAIVVTQHTGAVSALAIDRGWLASAGRDAKVARAPLANGNLGAVESATLPAGATRVVLDDTGAVHALLRSGAVARWSTGGTPIITIDHGARDVARARAEPAWAVAFDDGTLLALPLAPRTLPALRARLADATMFRLR